MKKGLIIITALAVLAVSNSFGQIQKYAGTWNGKVDVGVELRIVFHIKENGLGGLVSSADSPDQSAYGLKCDTTFISGEDIIIEMHALGASYSGRLIDDSTLDGTFKQTAEIPLRLRRGDLKPVERVRPQMPKPPFPYRSQDVEYNSSDKSLHYGATVTIPEGKGPFPAAVLITGSGPQNRDEEIMGHRPFAVLADALTRKGMIVLRVDDRGIGKSTGDFSSSTTADFAQDVSASVDYLLTRPEVDKKKIGLIGHSEGGMIAPMVAAQRKDINFVILLAGPGIKIIDLMTEQNVAIFRSLGVSEPTLDAYAPFYRELLTTVVNAPDSVSATTNARKVFDKWFNDARLNTVRELGLESIASQQKFLKEIVGEATGKWFRYFLLFDPAPYLQKMNCKVLALNGDKDIQVISKSNLAGIQAALKQGKATNYEIKELPGLNHLFQHCTKCTIQEYSQLEETFSPDALKVISDWFEKNVK